MPLGYTRDHSDALTEVPPAPPCGVCRDATGRCSFARACSCWRGYPCVADVRGMLPPGATMTDDRRCPYTVGIRTCSVPADVDGFHFGRRHEWTNLRDFVHAAVPPTVPEWVRRAQAGTLPASDRTAER